jgi:hypothetical protein
MSLELPSSDRIMAYVVTKIKITKVTKKWTTWFWVSRRHWWKFIFGRIEAGAQAAGTTHHTMTEISGEELLPTSQTTVGHD